jgi:phosphatidylserine decarboxylase
MNIRATIQKIFSQEDLNFLLTNRIPRQSATHFIGWFSQIRVPWIRDLSIYVWKLFTELDLSEAKKDKFDSLHDCFIRELRPGARPVDNDPKILTSPCDAIVGACGQVVNGQVFQAKGFPYTLSDLFGHETDTSQWQDGEYVTLRLTSSMYHRFHAPYDGSMLRVNYISGDTWNVNPIALKRIEKLFCKNERALLSLEIGEQRYPIALVPVAAILVASIRLHGIDTQFRSGWTGEKNFNCNVEFKKGEELGWFQHGSTIIVFAPKGFTLADNISPGQHIKMGQALMAMPLLTEHSSLRTPDSAMHAHGNFSS